MRLAPKFVIAIILFSLLAMPLTASVAVAADEVSFPDPILREVIRDAIGGGDITQDKLDLLTDLMATVKGIGDLTGMEHCTSLTKLSLAMNQIGNISPLSNLTNLTWLWLSVNQISDISPLSNLTGLIHLELYQNDISDISPLSNLSSLGFLWLHSNQISDISILSNLTGLYNLNLGYNQISDIEPLVSNTEFSAGDEVTLHGNPLNTDSIDIYIPQLEARGVEVNYDPRIPSGGGDGCFIATAAYGTPMAWEIDVLRQFRDEYLLTNPVGQALVELYYEISPPVAEFIDENPALKPIVRVGLAPAVAITTVAVSTTSAEKISIAGSLALVSVGLAVWLRKRALWPCE